MSEIKKGDWACVVKAQPCCGDPEAIGAFVTVIGFTAHDEYQQCTSCGAINKNTIAITEKAGGYLLETLKKIDPPATGEYDRVPVRKKEPA